MKEKERYRGFHDPDERLPELEFDRRGAEIVAVEDNYLEIPQPHEIPTREREDAMGSYLMMFASTAIGLPLPFVNLIASYIYYEVNKKKGPFVKFHLLQSLWSQLPIAILNSIAVVWSIVRFMNDAVFTNNHLAFIGTMVVLNILYFIFSIIAATRARKGRMYYFYYFGNLAYMTAFENNEDDEFEPTNRPPRF